MKEVSPESIPKTSCSPDTPCHAMLAAYAIVSTGRFHARYNSLEVIRAQSPITTIPVQTPDTACGSLLAWVKELASVLAVDTKKGV